MANKYPFRVGNYIYSRDTKKGFLRMQRLGVPRPLFSIENRMARTVKTYYVRLIKKLLKEIKAAARQSNATLDQAPLTQDEGLDDLLDFFDQMGKEFEEEAKKVANRANMQAAANTLEHAWFDGGDEDIKLESEEHIREAFERSFQQEQDDYLNRLWDDADRKLQEMLTTFSLDKQKLFNDNMDALRALYIDNSIQRLGWEENWLKRKVLERIIEYVNGTSDTLRLDDLTKLAYDRGDHMSRLFARDQMQRFNKAVTLSTFATAGIQKVKWVTCHDQRVRQSHKDLDGKIFNVDNLPPEIDDYNCRCGLVPADD